MRLIKINNKIFALNFEWRFKENSKKAEIIRKLEAEQESFDVLAYRQNQYAFANINNYSEHNYNKISSYVASINLPSNSFLGVFYLKDINEQEFYYLLAIKEGYILAMGDKCFGTKEEVDTYLDTVKSLANSFETEIYKDNEIESLALLESFLAKKLFYPKLILHNKELQKSSKPKYLLFSSVLFLILASFAYSYYKEEQARLEFERLAKMQQEYKQKLLANPEKHFSLAWIEALHTQDFLASCTSQILSKSLFENAWQLEEAICSEHELVFSYKQNANSNFIVLPDKAILESPTKALSRNNFSIAPKLARTDKSFQSLLSQDEVSRLLYQITRDFRINLKLNFLALEKKDFEGIELIAPFLTAEFELSSIKPIVLFDKNFQASLAFAGLVLESLETNTQDYKIKGKVYAKK